MAEPAFGKWEPIETAPKDGAPFLAYWIRHCSDGTRYEAAQAFVVAHFMGQKMYPMWIRADDLPTHWTPLPPPPASQGEGK